MLKGSTATDPDKTVLDAAGRFAWHLSDGWRSGFFPGLLWQLASHGAAASRALYAQAAARFTAGREHWKTHTTTHDVGFEGSSVTLFPPTTVPPSAPASAPGPAASPA